MARKRTYIDPHQSSSSDEPKDQAKDQQGSAKPIYLNGKDEMNLAEFPIARLGRNDTRLSIEYNGQITDKMGNVIQQNWIVAGNVSYGLPTEFADRVLVALMYITTQEHLKQENADRRVPFTIYRIIKLVGLSRNQRNYAAVEKALQQLAGVTIYSENAFWDHRHKKRVTTKKAFHIIEDFWLKSFDDVNGSPAGDFSEGDFDEWDEGIAIARENSLAASHATQELEADSPESDEHEKVTGYLVWGERIWDSFEAGYIKNLDVAFYYRLENTLARRLYRFLDKRMHYQESYQIDIFDLAARMGMKPYPFASHLARKLKPAFDELQAQGFLASVEIVKMGDFTRVHFRRMGGTRRDAYTLENDTEGPSSDVGASRVESITREDATASTPFLEPFLEPATLQTPMFAFPEVESAPGSTGESTDLPSGEPSLLCRQLWANMLAEYQMTLPAATYAMLASSQLRRLEPNHASALMLTATLAVEARFQEWITRQMARQIKAQLNQHLDGAQRVKDLLIISQ